MSQAVILAPEIELELVDRLGSDCLRAWQFLRKWGAAASAPTVSAQTGIPRGRTITALTTLYGRGHAELEITHGALAVYRFKAWQPRRAA